VLRSAITHTEKLQGKNSCSLSTQQHVLSENYLHEFHGILNLGPHRKLFDENMLMNFVTVKYLLQSLLKCYLKKMKVADITCRW